MLRCVQIVLVAYALVLALAVIATGAFAAKLPTWFVLGGAATALVAMWAVAVISIIIERREHRAHPSA